ncbi:biotin--[acetyl-CoA-carboxylase] ligase (plasmid) [Limosilactobacillus reuteri]|uniref:biotin--[biotin carboxyl-carrier protein] ligase n=1 Tax=Limosilactobacillus reuteri TaxID=1598 RepID=A0A3M6SGK7_LIMRT|nr:biotin--[acetyl-CoA-carboxylase] ligase [Limosilactobacillus reuteri]MRG90126.1 biotin--[acetyl-CoA-carboxylase] ligase [Limosilactobacillus reuteri]RMX26573.1 biotin--[acetyl-CoA-carboxylase] ligase [Limosilactobacillus reuteri]
MYDLLSINRIKAIYKEKAMTNCDFFYFDRVDSTQKIAKQFLDYSNINKPCAIFAGTQMRGYGKRNRSFYSPQNSGIYMSIIIPRYEMQNDDTGLLTISLGSGILEVFKKYYPKKVFYLKWVNDILLGKKKVAGIIVERQLDLSGIDSLIIGVGINLITAVFPNELKKNAASITSTIDIDFNKLSADLVATVLLVVSSYRTKKFLGSYRKRLILTGKKIKVRMNNRIIQGTVLGINDNGGLLLKLKNRKIQTLMSGDVIKVIY